MSELPVAPPHEREPHTGTLNEQLNWLRAGVLGANDGIVSVAGIVVGVAGATAVRGNILTAGLAGLVAGALSMAGGEYVSVSTQRDTERAAVNLERWELANMPDQELDELTGLYRARGLSETTARQVAGELTAHDPLRAHVEAELRIDADAFTNPWQAAGASFLAFTIGGILPFVAIMYPDASLRVWICVVAVVIGLILTGYLSAHLGRAPVMLAIVRNVGVGVLTMAVTWGVGRLFGVVTS
ncbi:MAG TPA: VIT family protein [Thermomicrobiales bacterium]|nr:VIT family protein [Thermomicrobiales bacterium]